MTRPRTHRRPSGFTLVELLVVILIVAILVALLFPAIMGAVATARNAGVTSEINNMSNALADFKGRYGDYPPSRILLMENGAFDTTNQSPLNSITWYGNVQPVTISTDMTYGQLAQRSLRYMRKFFSRVQFSSNSTAPIVITNNFFYDFNGNNNPDTLPIYLEGPECLAFFLGGIPNRSGTGTGTIIGMTGFAKSPTNPFQNATLVSNRQPPFFEFRNERLIDDDFDGIPGYADTLGTTPTTTGQGADSRYYAYFSSYGGGSYDPNDVNFSSAGTGIDLSDLTQAATGRVFRVNQPVISAGGGFPVVGTTGTATLTNWAVSPAPNPYTNSAPIPLNLTTSPPTALPANPPAVYQNPETFQIISAGRDRFYGVGGQYQANVTGDRLPLLDLLSTWSSAPVPCSLDPGIRQRENDNLTNFTTSKLN